MAAGGPTRSRSGTVGSASPAASPSGVAVGLWVAHRRGWRLACGARRPHPRHPAGPGHRPVGQLVEPGAVRRPDLTAVGCADRRQEPAARVRRLHHVPPHVPLRAAVEPGPLLPPGQDRPPPAAASRQPAAHLHRWLLPRPPLDRGHAHRHRHQDPRHPGQHLDVDHRHRWRGDRAGGEGAVATARRQRGALPRRPPLVRPAGHPRRRRRRRRRPTGPRGTTTAGPTGGGEPGTDDDDRLRTTSPTRR